VTITIVAGQDVREGQIRRRDQYCRPGSLPNTYNSNDLTQFQHAERRSGYADVELVKTIYGWSVRAGSGLDNFALLASARSEQVDGSWESALAWATQWCQRAKRYRYAWTREPVPVGA
jgi:hypothetical protein